MGLLTDWTPWPFALMNLATSGLWVLVLVLVVKRHRSGVKAVGKDYLALLLGLYIGGVFIPIGPVLWLVDYWRTRDHPVPGRPLPHHRATGRPGGRNSPISTRR